MHKALRSTPNTVLKGLVACVCNAGTWEVEAAGLGVQGFLGYIARQFGFYETHLVKKRGSQEEKVQATLAYVTFPLLH